MSEIAERDFGRLEAEVEGLRAELREHKEDSRRAIEAARLQIEEQSKKLDKLIALANQGRGAYWAALLLASGVGAIATKLINLIFVR